MKRIALAGLFTGLAVGLLTLLAVFILVECCGYGDGFEVIGFLFLVLLAVPLVGLVVGLFHGLKLVEYTKLHLDFLNALIFISSCSVISGIMWLIILPLTGIDAGEAIFFIMYGGLQGLTFSLSFVVGDSIVRGVKYFTNKASQTETATKGP